MFLGLFAVGLAAKRAAPETSLAVLFAAAQGPDLLWPLFLLLGIEQVRIVPGDTPVTPLEFVAYPWSHSLLMVGVWALLAAVVAANAPARDSRTARRRGLVFGARVLSHWILDVVTHRPDLRIARAGPARVGLGLWRSVPATLAVESLMYIAGAAIHFQATRAVDVRGRWLPAALVALLAALYLASVLGP